jgi:hypothetical protein
MSTEFRLFLIGVLFVVIFATGFWLRNTKRPFPVGKLNLHKLISLACLILSALLVNDLRGRIPLSDSEIAAIAVGGLSFLMTIISGGLVSLDKPAHRAVWAIHWVGPFLTLFATAASIYLLI